MPVICLLHCNTDGSFATSTASPCSDSGAAINAITVNAVSAGTWRSTINPVNYQLTVPSSQCQQCSDWSLFSSYCGLGPLQDNTLLCLLSFPGLQNYAPYNVSVSVGYADGNDSDTFNLPLPVTAYPWISVGLLRKLYNVPTGTAGGVSSNSQAVVEFLGQVCLIVALFTRAGSHLHSSITRLISITSSTRKARPPPASL